MNFDLFDLPDGLLESLQANWGTGLTAIWLYSLCTMQVNFST